MIFTQAQLDTWLAAFIWPLIRISAMVMSAPILSARQTPRLLRVGLVLVLTWVLVPVLPAPTTVPFFSTDAFLILLQQLLIGVIMGFTLQLVFSAMVFGGQVIAYSMGLGFASMMDPQNGVQVPVISQFYLIIATLVFLLFDGHLLLIELLARSFSTFPVATDGLGRAQFGQVVGWGSEMFSGGLLMALPVMSALLLVNLGMGVITRAAPQLNIFSVGFPLTILIGFILMWATLDNTMAAFADLFNRALQMLGAIFRV